MNEHDPSHDGTRDGLTEQDLRALLRTAVDGLQPSAGALDRLHHAVPARRARRRQTLVGAAAAVLLVGAGVPVGLHLTQDAHGSDAAPAMAGHQQDAVGRADSGGSDPHATGSGERPGVPPLPATGGPGAGGAGQRPGSSAGPQSPSFGGPPVGPTPGTRPLPPAAAPGVPTCGSGQLGVSGSVAGTPDADGKVYGSFKVTNVSATGCTVRGTDTVTSGPGTTVVRHTASDPAAGLPDPAWEASSLVLPPSTAYEIRFAWVPPAQACPPAPSPTPAAGGKSGAPDGQAPAAEIQGPPSAGPGVPVTLTPQPGATGTQVSVPSACGGTVYTTGMLPVAPPA
ncbi:hypothetical protein [Streptomyces sp. WAC06614]|uniref:hypothetical protein n=1 Tax=Streptomyces sp. WAC06614 TaxID=2487416 RepID=UPI000F797734|nr:hypothetical protein [Streptomyces sp. WAC06614]RSS79262.1 hypothetical protein EF918_18000 [Streptomyces sp. WAC06614]